MLHWSFHITLENCESENFTDATINKHTLLRASQRALERVMPGVSLLDQIKNEEIRRSTRVTDIAQRQRMDVGVGGGMDCIETSFNVLVLLTRYSY
ncbi:jg1633 [Pararge aegeria aegeria]|uniref:Jg1633 protein n=1 Tax=Pararge aegeria aegeria TaxID=348720 RepID=A0A8S4RBK4_9NEOP|nr:jg1633 [Pararge aegeria aegeria]